MRDFSRQNYLHRTNTRTRPEIEFSRTIAGLLLEHLEQAYCRDRRGVLVEEDSDTMDISKEPTGMESSIWQWLRAEKVMVYSRNN